MNIRPRNIPKFQTGGVPQWYLDRYGNRTSLIGWDMNKRYNYANQNLNTNDHRNAGSLDTVYNKNIAYTGTPGAISSDIQSFYNSDANGMSAEEFVNFYNQNAAKIRGHWAQDQTYNANTAGEHNRLFKRMFQSRSNQSQSPGSVYNIGYQDNLENIEGSSTWLRRMDQYENEFDVNNPDSNRLHQIKLKDGSTATVYKKANGDIGLFNQKTAENSSPEGKEQQQEQQQQQDKSQVKPQHQSKYGFDWSKIASVGQKIFGNPELYAFGRLAGNLLNNERVYDEQLKGIRPDLRQTYYTHRQVVGDEATKQGFYRRAAAGQTRAAQPFTSDADRQVAYMMEAKRVGDELRAQGDLLDNAEIRRTSDESNQHQWANTQRATEVANANIASINQANALKHNLLAQKHSAQWSSIDNFLKGIEYRKRQKLAEQQAFDDQIFTLQEQQDLQNDPEYLQAYKTYSDIIKAHTDPTTGSIDINNEEVVEAKRKFQQAQTDAAIRSYQRRKQYYQNRGTIYAKSGTKITHKKKEDLLYKSTRDVVEHFRKMSKIASDAQDRKKPKIEKLTSHPKGKTRKYQQGGVAPFTVYTPVALGGETTTSTELGTSRTSKSSSSKDSDGLDLMKELFKSLSVEGLPSDVNGIYQAMNNLMQRQQLFGTELSSSDVASMYLQQMQKINTIKFNKAQFDKTAEAVNSKDAGSEFAIDQYGRVAVQNTESGKVEYKKWDELKSDLNKGESKFNPLTNNDLLNLRAYSPSEAFSVNLLQVASNATSMTEIAKFLKAQLPNIGSSESTIEGYTKQDSNLIKAGLQLLKDAPAGDYKFTQYSKDQQKQAQMALGYLKSILPKNMRTLLQVNSEMQGVPADSIIASMIGSTLNENSRLEFDAVTGKASKDANGNSKESGDGLKLDAATALISGKGYQGAIEFNPGTSYAVTVNARHSGFQKKSGENMGSGITMQEATTSTLDKVLDWNKATLGGSRLNPTGYNRIMINSDDVVGVDLPVGSDKNTPDFTMLQKLQVLDQELLKKGIEDTPNNWKQVNQVCQEIGLPAKYKNDGSLNEYSWNRFAAFQVTADDSVLVDKNAILSDILGVVEDDNVREQYEQIIQKDNKNYKLGSGFLGLGKQALYQGTVFVPINSNYVASALSGGQNISMQQATNLELRERGYDQQKIATYKPGININEL